MVRKQTLKRIGGSVATVLPKSMLDRVHLGAGDTINVIETNDGLLITPFQPDFTGAMIGLCTHESGLPPLSSERHI
ncbi:MAG TPA: AbrB/MazE/SpoVT family DNA-binding domain-containing protein [Gemmatimonadaceae bacterium]